MPKKAFEESLRVSEALRGVVARSGLSESAIDHAIGWSRGTTSGIFNGRQPLRVTHVIAILEAIGETPGRFFGTLWSFEAPGSSGGGTGGREPRGTETGAGLRETLVGLLEELGVPHRTPETETPERNDDQDRKRSMPARVGWGVA
jgi:hypothetical protein